MNIFTAATATAPDSPVYGAAAAAGWFSGSLRTDDGLDLSAEFDAQASVRLGASVAGGLAKLQGDAGVAGHAGLRMQAALPLDLFESAGIVARLRLEASLNAQAQVVASMSLAELSDLITDRLPAELRPYVRLLIEEARIGATVWARASFAAMAVAEVTAVADLFPRDNRPAGISAVFRYGFAWGYGGSWGVTANYGFDTPRLLRRIADQAATDLGRALTTYRREAGIVDDNPLAGLIDASQIVLPATLGTLVDWCLVQRGASAPDQTSSLGDALLLTLRNLLTDALLPRLLQLAVDAIGDGLGAGGGEPDNDAVREVWVSTVRALTALQSPGDGSPLEPVGAVAALIAAAANLFGTPQIQLVSRAITCAGALMTLIADDAVADTPSLRALIGAPAGVSMKATAAQVLLDQLGGVLAEQGVLPPWAVTVFGDVVRITTLLAGGSAMTGQQAATALSTLLGDLETAFAGAGLWDHLDAVLSADLVRAVRVQIRILIDVCQAIAADDMVDAHRIREAVSTGVMILIGRPISEMSKAIADRGFAAVPPALRGMADTVDDGKADLDIDASWGDLARQVAGTTVGFPIAELMRHTADTTEQWIASMLPGELRLLDNYLAADHLASRILDIGPKPAIAEYKQQLLPVIGRHVVDHVLHSMEFLLKDSVNLFTRMAEGTATHLLRLFEVSVIVSFRLAEAAVIAAEQAFGLLQQEEIRLEKEVERVLGVFFTQVAGVANSIRDLEGQVSGEITAWLVRHCIGEAAAAQMPSWLRSILTVIVTGAVDMVSGGVISATQATVRALGDAVQASADALRIMAETQEGSDVGMSALIQSLFRGDRMPTVEVPIGIDVPNPFWPFSFIHIEITRIRVPANVIAGVVMTVLFDAAGVGPVVRALNETANSLRSTKNALASVRRAIAHGSPTPMREALTAAKQQDPMRIEIVTPQPGAVVPGQGKIVFRIFGINRAFIEPEKNDLPAEATQRVRVLLNGRQVPLLTMNWDYETAFAVGELPYSALGATLPQGVEIPPGAASITVLVAGGFEGGPQPVQACWHFVVEPAPALVTGSISDRQWFPIAVMDPFYRIPGGPLTPSIPLTPASILTPISLPSAPVAVPILNVPADLPILVAHQSVQLTRIVDHTGTPI